MSGVTSTNPDELVRRFLDLGDQLFSQGRANEAIDTYRRALAGDAGNFRALANLGTVFEALGRFNDARTCYEASVQHHPQRAEAHTNLAVLLYRTGESLLAYQEFLAALECDADDFNAHRGLALIYDACAEWEAAENHRRRAFAGRCVTTQPFHGTECLATVLLLQSSRGGDIGVNTTLDNRLFQLIHLTIDYADPTTVLPPYDAIFNAIGDADRNPEALAAAERFAASARQTVINRPAFVMETGRANVATLLEGIENVVVPRVIEASRERLAAATPETLAEWGLTLPLLVRPPGYHSGQFFAKVDSLQELADLLAESPHDTFLATQFIDYRSPDGRFRKFRVLFIDGELVPLHLAVSSHWMIHYISADMAGNDHFQAEEQAFLADMTSVLPPHAMAAVRAIKDRLKLDYAGIDCALSQDGKIVVFETNANMLIHLNDPLPEFAYRHAHVATVAEKFRSMILRHRSA